MAGYNYEQGMSNNAVEAYENGLVPASKIKGIPASLIAEHCRYEEWHHSSSHFNRVKFYSKAYVLATFGLLDSEDYEANEFAIAALKKHLEQKKDAPVVYKNCKVDWIEWGGSIRRPIPYEHEAFGCTVTVKGKSATINFKDGSTMIKRLATNGFSFITIADFKIREKEKRELLKYREKRERELQSRMLNQYKSDQEMIRVPTAILGKIKSTTGDRVLVAISGKKTIKGIAFLSSQYNWDNSFKESLNNRMAKIAKTVTLGQIFKAGDAVFFKEIV